jgi:hypothetical protein
MDPIGAALTLALVVSSFYRTIAGKRDNLTAGLWAAAFAMGIAALVVPLDAALKSVTGLDSLAQAISSCAFVVSSYLIARMTYHVAGIESRWPIIFTATSIAGYIALYCATELCHTQALAIESVPGAASAWLAVVFAIGLLPTHISAIIGVLQIRHKENILMWLLVIYGGVGALYPILIITDHIGTNSVRWQLSFLYPLVWVILLISLGALALAGAIGAYRTRQECRVLVGVPGTFSPS